MNSNNKKAFSLIEIITSIFVMAIITTYSMLFYVDIFSTNKNNFDNELYKLKIFNTKLFLEKNKNLENLKYQNNTLYFKDSPLLKDLSSYSINQNEKYYELNLCIKNKICQNMVILK